MEKIFVMVNGLPGNVAKIMARFAVLNNEFDLVPFSLTGQEIEENSVEVDNIMVDLVKPDVRDDRIQLIKEQYPHFIVSNCAPPP